MRAINFHRFAASAEFKKIQFCRCLYMIRPVSDERFGIAPKWIKVGISRTRLRCRLRAYLTYWPSGVDVMAVATVPQGPETEEESIAAVEKSVLAKLTRFGNTESCHADQADLVLEALRNDRRVYSIFTPTAGLRRNQSAVAKIEDRLALLQLPLDLVKGDGRGVVMPVAEVEDRPVEAVDGPDDEAGEEKQKDAGAQSPELGHRADVARQVVVAAADGWVRGR